MESDINNIPAHIAIIMDGNRRWARARNLNVSDGHKKGAETLENIAKYCNKIGIKYLTVYAFSTENWKRSKEEVGALMSLLRFYLDKFAKRADTENIRIKVLGAGGGGSNAVNRMIEDEIQNVDFIVVDTNAISAAKSKAQNIIQIGENEAKGIGAGANPEVGENSAKENAEEIAASLVNTDLLFLTAGMGGGTGTGALPVIAEMAKEMGILTIGIVTKPFKFEGKMREKKAMTGIEKLKQNVDALIVIENDKLLKINSDNVTIVDAFKQADNTLKQGIVGITDLLNTVGEINIDFADISTIISIRGLAYMGIGSAIGENALAAATRKAIDNPLTAVNINGAKGIIINIQGSKDLSLSEINSSVAIINDIVDEDANIIFGTVINEDLGDEVIVTVIATGVDEVY